jgi:hypothetical protein
MDREGLNVADSLQAPQNQYTFIVRDLRIAIMSHGQVLPGTITVQHCTISKF